MKLHFNGNLMTSVKCLSNIINDMVTTDEDNVLSVMSEYVNMIHTGKKQRTIKVTANNGMEQKIKINLHTTAKNSNRYNTIVTIR